MLLPTQKTAGLVATSMMQSMLDGIEDRRREDDEKKTGKKNDPVTEAKISASIEAQRARDKIAEALFSVNNTDPNELKIQLVERLAEKLGVDLEEDRSNFTLGKVIEDIVKNLGPDEIGKLENDLGLDAAGVSLATLVAAIKNPYGDDNERLMDGLSKQANGGKAVDLQRVIQRLEDVADPKTLEELKLGPQGYDPTRVEDAGTRSERQQDIQTLEAAAKLEDVQEMQDAIETRNDNLATAPASENADAGSVDDTALLVTLAAAVEQTPETEGSEPTVKDADQPASGIATKISGADEGEVNEINAKAIEALVEDQATDIESDVLPISVDDIGIYELLKKKLAA